jgi:hypothetical protein
MSSSHLHRPTLSLAICAALLLASSHTIAQAPPPTTLASLNLTCSDFKQNGDGSWSPTHPITIVGAKLGPGSHLVEGTVIGGAPIATLLNKECGH